MQSAMSLYAGLLQGACSIARHSTPRQPRCEMVCYGPARTVPARLSTGLSRLKIRPHVYGQRLRCRA